MRYTYGTRMGYFVSGFFIIWLLLPISFVDMMIMPEWYASNWQCDSLGIPMMETFLALVPWAIISASVSAIFVFLLVRKRQAGAAIINIRLGKPSWSWIVTLSALAMIVLIAFDVVSYLWQAMVPQTISTDCGGRAELVTVTMRGPLLQLLPVVEITLVVWILHIRALLLSPRQQ